MNNFINLDQDQNEAIIKLQTTRVPLAKLKLFV